MSINCLMIKNNRGKGGSKEREREAKKNGRREKNQEKKHVLKASRKKIMNKISTTLQTP